MPAVSFRTVYSVLGRRKHPAPRRCWDGTPFPHCREREVSKRVFCMVSIQPGLKRRADVCQENKNKPQTTETEYYMGRACWTDKTQIWPILTCQWLPIASHPGRPKPFRPTGQTLRFWSLYEEPHVSPVLPAPSWGSDHTYCSSHTFQGTLFNLCGPFSSPNPSLPNAPCSFLSS